MDKDSEAQPYPAGQGGALAEAARRVISDIDSGDYHGDISEATYAALQAALAARQPVGEAVAWMLINKAGIAIDATRHARERESWEVAGGATEPLYAAPRVQDVDGYQAAFYELADMMSIPAQPCSPKEVWEMQIRPALQAAIAAQGPVPVVLHCPRCHLQHIDAPDERTPDWKNPPHRSHLCHGCGLIWRPADVATVGVASTQTTGSSDMSYTAGYTVDLGPYRDAVMHAYGIVEPDDYFEKLGELLDLIDSQA